MHPLNARLTPDDSLPPEQQALLTLVDASATPYLRGESARYTAERYTVGNGVIEVHLSGTGTVVWAGREDAPPPSSLISEDLVRLLLTDALLTKTPSEVAALLANRQPDLTLRGWYFVENVYRVLNWQIKLCYPCIGSNKTEAFHLSVCRREIPATGPEVCRVSSPAPEILYAAPMFFEGGLCIDWGAKNIGFGQLYLSNKNGPLECDSECMSPEFVQAVLAHLAKEINVLDGKTLKAYEPAVVTDADAERDV